MTANRLDSRRVGAYFAGLSGGSSAIASISTKPWLPAVALALLCSCGGQSGGPDAATPAAGGADPSSARHSGGNLPESSVEAGPVQPGPEIERPAGRLLLVGIDAADERLIRPLVDAGRLPTLARFYREGSTGPLRSHEPMLSPILWTSIATGVSPTAHGVLDFIEVDAGGRAEPVGSRARHAAAIWDVLGERGLPVAVVGWLATFPATSVNGWLVSDRFTIHPFETTETRPAADPAGKCYPRDLYDEVEGLIVRPGDLSREEIEREFDLPRANAGRSDGTGARDVEQREERALAVVSSTTRTHAAVARWLALEKRPAFEAVYFDGLDRLLHLFSDASLPALPGSDPRRVARYGGVAESYLASLDLQLAGLIEAAGPEVTVIVVSDHGWLTGADRPAVDPGRDGPFAAEWHREEGILLAMGPDVRRGARIVSADIYDIAPTVLAFYGLPAARDFRGKTVTGLFDSLPSPGAKPPDSYGPGPDAPAGAGTPEDPTRVAGGKGAPVESEAEVAVRNLRGLGYIGGGDSAVGSGRALDRSLSNLATVHLDEGRSREAVRLYERFLETAPADYDSLFNLAWARRQLGEPEAARRTWLRAAAARPRSPEPWISIAELEAERKQWPAVSDAAARAADLDPDNALAWNLSAAAACEQGNMTACEEGFRRAIRVRPGSPGAYVNLSRLLESQGRNTEAIALLRQGLDRSPSDPRLLRRLEDLGSGG